MASHPRFLGLGTAVPAHVFVQDEVKAWAARLFNGRTADIKRLMPAFDNAGIETRYSCVSLSWHENSHGWVEKNRLYLKNAIDLMSRAALGCLESAGLGVDAVDAVVAVSSSGFATPSLDALVIERLGLGRRVLFLVAELCGLTFRPKDASKSNVIATVLFSDGAAAALISTSGEGPEILHPGEHTWAGTLDVMGWNIEDDGFGVLFSQDIPSLVTRELPPVLDAYLGRHGMVLDDFDGFICHPGGAKVIASLERVFQVSDGNLGPARSVLRDYGNMSAATVMFVLDRVMAEGKSGRYLMSALGPGFSVGFLTLKIP